MPKKDHFYITTTLPYINAKPHVGHAVEFVRADIIARFNELKGNNVFFNTGVDEHGLKIYKKAKEENMDPQKYADKQSEEFKKLTKLLDLKEDINFIRTTDPEHMAGAQEFWRKCRDNGYIYKKNYKINYCVGCELEKANSDLVDGKCPEHPNDEIETIEEENYFFKFSEFQKPLLELYEKNPGFVIPNFRLNEVKKFTERGLEDFSISRLKNKMPWGVPVPDDDEHVMYVWFDALVNYISAIGWPSDMDKFNKYWPVVQYAGKDNLRQQSAMWQAMLLSVDLPPSEKIVINGFVISGGVKMSKSIGNVIDPVELISEYGVDALRYFIARELSNFEDSDLTSERFKEAYNANLANGLGNLTSRIMKMSESNLEEFPVDFSYELPQEFSKYMDNFDINKATDYVWKKISELDQRIQKEKPFTLQGEEAKRSITSLVKNLWIISVMLKPILPSTAENIQEAIKKNKKPKALFERK